MAAKEPTVERRHRLLASELVNKVASAWVGNSAATFGLSAREVDLLTRAAQLIANVEAAAAAEAAEPFRLLMAHYEQGERVELYVGEGGSIYAEGPSCYVYGDDAVRAVESLCRVLGLLPSEPAKEEKRIMTTHIAWIPGPTEALCGAIIERGETVVLVVSHREKPTGSDCYRCSDKFRSWQRAHTRRREWTAR